MTGWNGLAWVPGNPELPEALPCADKNVNDLLVKYNVLGCDLKEANAAVAEIQAKEHAARDADIEAQADAILNGSKKTPALENYRAWCVEVEEAKSKALAVERARAKTFDQLKSAVISDRDKWKQRIGADLDEHVAKMTALLDELEQIWVSATLLLATDGFLDQNADHFHVSPGLLASDRPEATIANLKADVRSQFGED